MPTRGYKYSDEELFLRVMIVTPDTPWGKSRDEQEPDSVEGLALQVLTRVKNGTPLPTVAHEEEFTTWDWVVMDIYRRYRRRYPDVERYRSLLNKYLREHSGLGGVAASGRSD
ncbi:MAG: hypothetical protein H8K08_06660 [Nitrospira sp.]|nr:hypothetical protein [Nitrospira sp.]